VARALGRSGPDAPDLPASQPASQPVSLVRPAASEPLWLLDQAAAGGVDAKVTD
jgi:hypothetical protein